MRRVLFALSALPLALGLNTRCEAHDLNAYICGGSDAKASFSSFDGGLVVNLGTSASGTSSAGYTLTDIDSGNQVGKNFFSVNFAGTATANNGPFVFLETQEGNDYVVPITAGAAHKIKGGTTYVFSNTTFGAARGQHIDEIVVQLNPSTNADSVMLGGNHVNGATFTIHTKLQSECPE